MPEPRFFQFYAIIEDDEGSRSLKRIRMEQGIKAEVSTLFEEQVADFLPADLERIDYDPGYTPDESEVFALADFPLPRFLAVVVHAPDAPETVSQADIEDGLIKALVAVEFPWLDATSRILFQSFDARQTITKKKWYLSLGQANFTRLETPGLAIGTKLSAVLTGGTLLFRSQHIVRRFLDVDEAFEVATNEQIGKLLAHSAFAHGDLADVLATADRWIRRKVASIERRGTLDRVTVDEIVMVADEFKVEIDVITTNGTNQIKVPTEKKELKRLVRLLDEDLYVSPLTGDHFQANSKRKLPGLA